MIPIAERNTILSYANESIIIHNELLASYSMLSRVFGQMQWTDLVRVMLDEKVVGSGKKKRITVPWQSIRQALVHGDGYIPDPWKTEWNSKFAPAKEMKAKQEVVF